MDSVSEKEDSCPICDKKYPLTTLNEHVNKCIFLNSVADENRYRKRAPSPVFSPPKRFKQPSSSKEPVADPKSNQFGVPLAAQCQPKSLDDFVGQNHIFGTNSVLRSLFEKDQIPNMILWGPPGCGKTSLAGIIRNQCQKDTSKLRYTSLSATSSGIKDVQTIISQAKNHKAFGKRTVLFMDEIHRFNKKQQDVFLLPVEKGEVILVGATTENPSFCINDALLSRCRVVVLNKLEPENLLKILKQAVEVKLGLSIVKCNENVKVEKLSIQEDALEWLADISDGDARIALSNLQLVAQLYDKNMKKLINVKDIEENLKKTHLLYDRKGEEHYNIISAMHKSIRGSDPNAALYWTTRMIVSGEDPLFIARRMVRAASEDIGNADINALKVAVNTMQGCQLLGMPECDVLLAQCAIYLARAPKSREADSALALAKKTISECKGSQPSVPLHLRNAPTKLMKQLGYGKKKSEDAAFMPTELVHVDFFK